MSRHAETFGASIAVALLAAFSFYACVEFVKLCNWIGQYTWP